MTLLAGVFVGGRSRRMGGHPKALLRAPGEDRTLVERTVAVARAVGADVVLVGRTTGLAMLDVETIADVRDGAGPLAGLVSLLDRDEARGDVLALACDMPFLSEELVRRLATHALGAAAVAVEADGVLQPLVARYRAAAVAPIARAHLAEGRLALRDLLAAVNAIALPASESEAAAVDDWDRPADVLRVFAFEEIGGDLELVPLAARRALDVAGCKLPLASWQRLPLRARRRLCALGTAPNVDTAAVRHELRATAAAFEPIAPLADPAEPPPAVEEAVGRAVIRGAWPLLPALERYALAKVARKRELDRVRRAFAEIAAA